MSQDQAASQPKPRVPRPTPRPRTQSERNVTFSNGQHHLDKRARSLPRNNLGLLEGQTSIEEEVDIYTDDNSPLEAQVVPPEAQVVPPEAQVVPPEAQVVPPEAQVIPPKAQLEPPEAQVVPPEPRPRSPLLNTKPPAPVANPSPGSDRLSDILRQKEALRHEVHKLGLSLEGIHLEKTQVTADIEALQKKKTGLEDDIRRLKSQVDDLASQPKQQQQQEPVTSQREQLLNRREQALRKREEEFREREEQFNSVVRDHEFHMKQEESRLQALDDMLVMRKKNLDHREFDMRNSSDHGESAVSAQMAELADRQFAVQQRETELQQREFATLQKEQNLKEWSLQEEARLNHLHQEFLRRESELNARAQPQRPVYPTHPPYQLPGRPVTEHIGPVGPPYQLPGRPVTEHIVPVGPSYQLPIHPVTEHIGMATTTPAMPLHSATTVHPHVPLGGFPPPGEGAREAFVGGMMTGTVGTSGMMTGTVGTTGMMTGTVGTSGVPVYQPNDLGSSTGGPRQTPGASSAGAGGYTPSAPGPKPSFDLDAELAQGLQHGDDYQLKEDEEFARKLWEEEQKLEEQRLAAQAQQLQEQDITLDHDHQLALQLQKEDLEVASTNEFGSTEQQDDVRKALQDNLTRVIGSQEQEKQDLLLAQRLQGTGEPEARNDLGGSSQRNDLDA